MNSNSEASAEEEWIGNLVHEAARDLVFLWNVTSGSFGGSFAGTSVPLHAQERAISALLTARCKVGFGDPDSSEWLEPTEILKEGSVNAGRILEMLAQHPEEYKFLVFARRC